MGGNITRRDVLRGLGGVALTSTLGCGRDPETAQTGEALGTCDASTIDAVENHARVVSDVQAYAQKSVTAGSTIDFHISSPLPYTLSIVRLGWDTDTPVRDWTLHSFPEVPGEQQVIRPGSYIHVESALPSLASYAQMTLECWVRPFNTARQGLISQYTEWTACGFGLFLGDDGRPYLYFGDGGVYNPAWIQAGPSALEPYQWHHLAAVFDNGTVTLYVDGALADTWYGFLDSVTPGTAPLRLGAHGDDPGAPSHEGTGKFLDGDLAMPVIYSRALEFSEISTRATTLPPVVPDDPTMFGCWPLTEEAGQYVSDVSGCDRAGLIVNHGTWMIGGPGFDAAATPRFGYDPDTDSTRGHALRLSSSDLYDCGWPISQSYTLPSDVPPGVYVGRIIDSDGGRYDVTFVVRGAESRPAAPIVVLCATNTWHAYNRPLDLFSFYQFHATGQPTYFTGIEMPWNNSTDPYLLYTAEIGYSHLVRAERFLHVWLEQNGYDYDCISDLDLHQNPTVLSSYRVLFIAGHSEYWSHEAWTAVRDYVSAGGQVIVASGNTMFWRVSFDAQTLECRKYPDTVGGFTSASWGELFHASDHQRGGLMREAGYPAWQAIGLECVGYGGARVAYSVTNPTHPFFQSPEPIAVDVGSEIGGPYAVGHEWDTRLQQIPGSLTPSISPDYTPVVLAEGRSGEQRIDYQANWIDGLNQVMSEITDWVKPGGGRIFAAGSIAAGQGLSADPAFAALFRNALHAMGVVFRVNALAIGQDGHLNNKYFDGTSWGPSGSTWEDMGGGFSNPPAGVQWGPNSLAIGAITSAGLFYYKYWDGAAWSGWDDFGGAFVGRPAMVGWGRNRLDLFARGIDDHLYTRYWDGSAWSSWIDLGDSTTSDPAAVVWEGNRRAVAVCGPSGNILYRYGIGDDPWMDWYDMGGNFAYAPTFHFWGGKNLGVFAVDATGHMFYKYWDGSVWSPSDTWDDMGGALASRVHVGAWGKDQFTIFAIDQDGHLQSMWWNGASFTDWSDLGGTFIGEPAVAAYRGGYLSVLATQVDGRVQHRLWDGSAWSDWQDMGDNMRGSPAAFRWIST